MTCYLSSYASPPSDVLTLESFRKVSPSSKQVPPHKSLDSPRRRKRSRGKRAKPHVLSPLAFFAARLVLHENLSNDGQKEEAIVGGSPYNPFVLDFPEIKWVEDENEDSQFPFPSFKGSPEDDLFVDLVYQKQDPRVIQSRLTLRKQGRLTKCLHRSKTVRRDLTGTFNP
jgi:hypothetical protein